MNDDQTEEEKGAFALHDAVIELRRTTLPRAALTQQQPDRPCIAHKKNFDTLIKAFRRGDVCLMECTIKATGERVAVICAAQELEGGVVEFVPFAVMPNGNPYELLDPPPKDSEPTPQDRE